jgi:hypothetical protein
MRIPPASSALAPALTAYATDLTLIGTALRPQADIKAVQRARRRSGVP